MKLSIHSIIVHGLFICSLSILCFFCPGQEYESMFLERAQYLIDFAADIYRPPFPNYSDPEKVYWPVTIARLTKYGNDDEVANGYIDRFCHRSPFHFILVGMARLMPLFESAPQLAAHKLQYLENVMNRKDSYNPWSGEGTENHINMSRTSGYIFAEAMEDYPDLFPEATAMKDSMKRWIGYYASTIYRVGTGEFNASTYGAYNIIGWLNLYDFARDPVIRKKARAVLDYYACETALHYLQGMTGGPESRGAPQAIACRTETDYLGWLWFGDLPRPVDGDFFVSNTYKPPLQSIHAATSNYRPPREAVWLAKKRFAGPVLYRNSKPAYLLCMPSYVKHMQYIHPDFSLGSAFYPYGAFGSSCYKNVTWKLISRVEYGMDADPQMVTGGGMYYPDMTGKMRNPWLQVAQHKNVLIQLNKSPLNAAFIVTGIDSIYRLWSYRWQRDFVKRFSSRDDKLLHVGNPVKFQTGGRTGEEGNGAYVYFPDVTSWMLSGDVLFLELERCYAAIRSLADPFPLVMEGKYAVDRAPPGMVCGLLLEVLPASQFESFREFRQKYPGRTALDRSRLAELDRICYTAYDQTQIEATYREKGTFTEPIYDWGYGVTVPLVIQTSPPFVQPRWPEGKGHGRIASWSVNGNTVDLDTIWPVYSGPHLEIGKGVLTIRDGSGSVYCVDFRGEIPEFSRNDVTLTNPGY